MIKAIDLCCDAGGWAAAARGLPIQWVCVVDLAADCLETWDFNHRAAHSGCVLVEGDLTQSEALGRVRAAVAAAGGVDLVVGAIPCEQLSQARRNKPPKPGEMEAVHNLIDACFALVKEFRPRWWCFEDVTAVETHLPPPLEFGLPYECWRIDASLYGPQRRIRTFFGSYPPLAKPEPGPRTLGDVLRPGPHRTIRRQQEYQRSQSRWYSGKKKRVFGEGELSTNEREFTAPFARALDVNKACPTVADFSSRHERGSLVPIVTGSYACDPLPYGHPQPAGATPPSIQDRPQDPVSPSPCVVSGKGDRIWPVVDDGVVRCLEWQEAALLQGFPADYVFAASWSRTWKMVGQAIPIYVGRAILRAIVKDANS